jgi:hypothetical protein
MHAHRHLLPYRLLLALMIAIPRVVARVQTTSAKQAARSAPGLRKLADPDATRAEELDKAIAASLRADRFDEAIAKAQELVALRTKVQGPKHFEAMSAEWHLKTLRRMAPMLKEDRIAFQLALTMIEQATQLNTRGQYVAAETLLEKAPAIYPRLLTDHHPHTLAVVHDLAHALNTDRPAQAEPLFRQAPLDLRPHVALSRAQNRGHSEEILRIFQQA